jgi:hypothetical protein
MSSPTPQEPMASHTTTNGAAPTATKGTKRRIAVAAFDGGVGTLKFSDAFGGHVLTVDTKKLPAAYKDHLAAYGAVTAIQAAYSVAENPFQAAQDTLARLERGEWSPGPPRREAEPDELLQALKEHLEKETGKPITHGHVEKTFIPAYQAKHGLGSVGAARRRLRSHPDIAPRVAAIQAERARNVAASVKGAPKESLVL